MNIDDRNIRKYIKDVAAKEQCQVTDFQGWLTFVHPSAGIMNFDVKTFTPVQLKDEIERRLHNKALASIIIDNN